MEINQRERERERAREREGERGCGLQRSLHEPGEVSIVYQHLGVITLQTMHTLTR